MTGGEEETGNTFHIPLIVWSFQLLLCRCWCEGLMPTPAECNVDCALGALAYSLHTSSCEEWVGSGVGRGESPPGACYDVHGGSMGSARNGGLTRACDKTDVQAFILHPNGLLLRADARKNLCAHIEWCWLQTSGTH